ncbi:MAG: hypothetical protein HC772_16805 [Leptolyngbyaceae cyanobacterium CRU_2_3]|nr:hypothetical protein [Leptolyngbyaceae cyanobacterium CRU_2_3]
MLLLKLLTQGFKPVFANEVFVIFTTCKTRPSLAYTSQHVKPLYIDLLKRDLVQGMKWVYQKYLNAKRKPA